jgi:hypothetical protein
MGDAVDTLLHQGCGGRTQVWRALGYFDAITLLTAISRSASSNTVNSPIGAGGEELAAPSHVTAIGFEDIENYTQHHGRDPCHRGHQSQVPNRCGSVMTAGMKKPLNKRPGFLRYHYLGHLNDSIVRKVNFCEINYSQI